MKSIYNFETNLWLYPGNGGWFFVSVPKNLTNEISEQFADYKRGWSSLKVEVTIGKTTWKTSIFPDSKSGTYLLPVKAEVRKKEELEEGQNIKIMINILI